MNPVLNTFFIPDLHDAGRGCKLKRSRGVDVHFALTQGEADYLMERARRSGRTRSQLIRDALRAHLIGESGAT